MIPDPTYLGDGVYASIRAHDHSLVITTSHHHPLHADNVIYIDPIVLSLLIEYAKRAGLLQKEGA